MVCLFQSQISCYLKECSIFLFFKIGVTIPQIKTSAPPLYIASLTFHNLPGRPLGLHPDYLFNKNNSVSGLQDYNCSTIIRFS